MYFSFHYSVKNHYCKIISFTDELFFLDSKYFSQKNFEKTLRIYFFFDHSVKIFVTSHFIIIYFSLKVIKFLFRKLLSVMYMNFIWGMFVYCSPSLQYQTALKTINTLQVYESFSCLPSSLMRLRCSQSNKKLIILGPVLSMQLFCNGQSVTNRSIWKGCCTLCPLCFVI